MKESPIEERSAGDPPPPGEEVEVGESRRVEFPCDSCGADMVWDPEADALACDYCGNHVEVPRREGTILERPLDEAPTAERGLGIDLRVASCGTCDARVTFEGKATSELCVYCGSANVLEQEANRNAIRPESLVPLDVSRAQVEESFRKWIRRLWFRPNALKKTRRFQAVGIYVPFWTFDAQVHSDWSADAGHYYYVMVPQVTQVKGKTVVTMRQERRVRWVPAWGSRDDHFDDLLIHASQGQPADLVRKLGGFDTRGLVPYEPQYLAGHRAEEYGVDLDEGWERGQEAIADAQRSRCSSDVPGDTQRRLQVQNHISEVRWKHVLLPIWSLQYAHGGKTYTVLVHGMTGKVAGRAPLSWTKILLLVFGILAVIAFAMGIAMGAATL